MESCCLIFLYLFFMMMIAEKLKSRIQNTNVEIDVEMGDKMRIIHFRGEPIVVPIRGNRPIFEKFDLNIREAVREAWNEDWRVRNEVRIEESLKRKQKLYDDMNIRETVEYEQVLKKMNKTTLLF